MTPDQHGFSLTGASRRAGGGRARDFQQKPGSRVLGDVSAPGGDGWPRVQCEFTCLPDPKRSEHREKRQPCVRRRLGPKRAFLADARLQMNFAAGNVTPDTRIVLAAALRGVEKASKPRRRSRNLGAQAKAPRGVHNPPAAHDAATASRPASRSATHAPRPPENSPRPQPSTQVPIAHSPSQAAPAGPQRRHWALGGLRVCSEAAESPTGLVRNASSLSLDHSGNSSKDGHSSDDEFHWTGDAVRFRVLNFSLAAPSRAFPPHRATARRRSSRPSSPPSRTSWSGSAA